MQKGDFGAKALALFAWEDGARGGEGAGAVPLGRMVRGGGEGAGAVPLGNCMFSF